MPPHHTNDVITSDTQIFTDPFPPPTHSNFCNNVPARTWEFVATDNAHFWHAEIVAGVAEMNHVTSQNCGYSMLAVQNVLAVTPAANIAYRSW